MWKWYFKARVRRLLWQGIRTMDKTRFPSLYWPYWKRASLPKMIQMELRRRFYRLF